jgi:hypothetical protein
VKVIGQGDLGATVQQRIDEVRADEPGASGHEYPHGREA